MTRQEIIKEAEEKAKELSEHPLKEFCKFPLHWTDFDKSKESCYMNGYLAGAEPREKRIAELEAQIEKMKCCGNCKHRYFIGDELECHLLDNGINCDNEDKWEIKEND